MSNLKKELKRLRNHPLKRKEQEQFIFLEPISIWRAKNEIFYFCNEEYARAVEKACEFDFEEFLRIVEGELGCLPDGYYFAAHRTKTGGFLHTDDYDEMIDKLKEKKLIR